MAGDAAVDPENETGSRGDSPAKESHRFDSATGKALASPFKYRQVGMVAGQVLVLIGVVGFLANGLSLLSIAGLVVGIVLFVVSVPKGLLNA